MKKAVLLDVSAIMYRAFYGNLNFRTKNEPTGAVYGFVNTLLSIINQLEPDYIGAAFDVKRSTLKRTEMYKEYKAQRESAPEDLVAQIPRIEELLDCFGIKKFKIDGYEADDVLGSLAKELGAKDINSYIITGDKDLSQILDGHVNIALLGKGDGGGLKILSTEEDVIEQLGVKPNMIPDLFGLIGDSSDGIPGVRKIGSKKAIPMLQKYENLEGIYENIDSLTELPGIGKSLVNNLIEDKELAFISRDLATIEIMHLDLKENELEYKKDNKKLLNLFKTLEFKSLIKKMGLENEEQEKVDPQLVQTISQPNNGMQLGLFSFQGTPEVLEEKGFDVLNGTKIKEKLNSSDVISIFLGEKGVAVSLKNKDYYIPLDNDEDKKYFQEILNSNAKFISYGFKNFLRKGYSIKNMEFDSMLAYHLLTSQTREEVEVMLKNVLDEEIEKYSEVFGKTKIHEVSLEEYGKFLVKRSRGILVAYPELMKELEVNNLYEVLKETEMPLIRVLADMEIEGIKISPEYFSKYSLELEEKLEQLTKKIYEDAQGEFNINSPKQLGEVLFINLNIPPIKKTKTGFSTDGEVLEKLAEQGYEIAKYILEFRKLSKLKSTYVDPLPKMVDQNNRLHTTFNQTGTATGRLSSSDPNLQNIPVRTEDGMKIRAGFIAKEGSVLLGIDYSQIELRVLAEISQDENLIEAYSENQDLHSLTARKIFDLREDETVTREQRDAAKTVNFSIIYGKTAFGLSQELKISPKEASEYITRYFEQYPSVKHLEKEIIMYAEEHGYVETYFKRKRIIEGINSKNRVIKSQAERMAVNTVIQGTAAEVLKKVMINLYNFLKDKNDIYMLLQVHDELIFEVEKDKVLKYKEEIEKIMRESIKFSKVKLEVNSSIGNSWAETK
ncbi:DNA polymerase I [Candidatus Cetobacterium colombiensis]|uniref:DNA polymerase I n=1 Tax=Candidatus Cetobacterium colombiensis TaxID=3073100 RepID=A0ABU4W9Z1_9FUSO|nr:DNA polymerase I [Candidatus Cetobacterium colombiensis]MDX8335318.1 DNA polymerase I [Candidatus Cetobacterium colombiensis]